MKTSHHTSISGQIKKGLLDKGITTRSIVAFFIFGMIVLVFVLSDLSGRGKGSSSMGSAAEVNGELISFKDFQDEENRLAQYYAQMLGGQFDSEMQKNMLRGEVMNSLVTKSVASQAAEKEGIYATDAEVRYMIAVELPYFKKDGVFQSEVYKSLLQANKLTPGEFEKKLRQDIKNQRSRQLFESSLVMSELQKNIERELRSSKLNLEYIQLSSAEYAKANQIGADEIAKAFSKAEFSKKVEDNYNANKALYETAEQVRAAHILIKSDAADDAAASKKAEETLKRLAKEDFGKVAAAVSDDPGSKVKNGDLGFFSRGQMVKEFEEVAFVLPVGKVSGLVKTPFGYHIIKVTDKKAAQKADFDSVKSTIARKLISDEKYLDFISSIEKGLSSGKSEDVIGKMLAAKLNWKETGYFDISSEVAPLMNSSQAVKMAMSLSRSEPLAKKLIREGDTQFLIKLKDIKTDQSDLKAQDQTMLERQKSMGTYQAWIDSFKKSAQIETNSGLTASDKQ
ncbi:MAG: SurA N-terminal domain-containing protein [Bdellovibrionota bacterium]